MVFVLGVDIGAVAFDFDETLSLPGGVFLPQAAYLLGKLREKKLLVFLVTGRPLEFVLNALGNTRVDGIVAEQGNVLYDAVHGKEVLRDGSRITRLFSDPRIEVKESSVEVRRDMEDEIRGVLEENGVGFEITRNKTRSMFVVPGTSKEDGLRRMLARFGLSLGRVLSFGDAENDIGFLGKSGVSVAVGNALDSVKKVASRTTKKPYLQGVAEFLEAEVF